MVVFIFGDMVFGMTKKKGKGKAARKVGKKRSKKTNKGLNVAEVRKDLESVVIEAAHQIAVAVTEEAKKGQLAPAKYLLEAAGIYPPSAEGDASRDAYEESLAETLMHRLNIPVKPFDPHEDDEPIILPPLESLVREPEDEEKVEVVEVGMASEE